jgi:hypothetical protein
MRYKWYSFYTQVKTIVITVVENSFKRYFLFPHFKTYQRSLIELPVQDRKKMKTCLATVALFLHQIIFYGLF